MTKPDSPRPKLPSISDLMTHPSVQGVVDRINQTTVARRATGFLDEMQSYWRQRAGKAPSLGELAERFAHHLLGEATISAPAINATGIVLGSKDMVSSMADEAVQQMLRLAGEFHETDSVQAEQVGRLFRELIGAEAVWVASSFDGANHLLTSVHDERHETVVTEFAGIVDPAKFGLESIPTVKSHLSHCDLALVDGSGCWADQPAAF